MKLLGKLPAVLLQYSDDSSALRVQRMVAVGAPHIELQRLARLDERLYAHLDGLMVAGDAGYRLAQEALETPGIGQLFTLAVLAIERHDRAQIDRLLALVDVVPDAARALVSAFGWVSAVTLRGFAMELLASADPLPRWLGLAACAAHRVDAGAILDRALEAADTRERALALKSAGVLGRTDRLGICVAHLADDDARCRLHAAASATLLGGGAQATAALRRWALTSPAEALEVEAGESVSATPRETPPTEPPGERADRDMSLRLSLLCATPEEARQIVRQLAGDPLQRRRAVQASGWAGDLQAVPWLLELMDDPRHARVAGEAFTWLTGADLAAQGLEGPAPQGSEVEDQGPTDDADDDRVALDDDESLPWPDPARVRAWWQAQGPRGDAAAAPRMFLGAPPSAEHLLHVLRTGGQRQRMAAALLQKLTQPEQALFNVAAPSPRQRRSLGLPTKVV